jgi:NTE family protein
MKIIILILMFVISACQHQQKVKEANETQTFEKLETSQTAVDTNQPVTTPVNAADSPKLGLILGPGGGRAIAQIGVLKRISEKRIPVVGIVGIEWGAVVGSLYSQKSSANEAEWQLSKIRIDKFQDQTDAKDMLSSMSTYLQSAKVESGRIAFGCPSLNIKKSQVFFLARGRLDQLLPYCLAYPPVSKPYDWSIAGAREISRAAEFLRSRGANRIVFVNVLPGLPLQDPVNWHELAFEMKKKWAGVDHRLDILIERKSIRDYKFQTELVQLGYDQSVSIVEMLEKLNQENP